jgi:hypothetical protein
MEEEGRHPGREQPWQEWGTWAEGNENNAVGSKCHDKSLRCVCEETMWQEDVGGGAECGAIACCDSWAKSFWRSRTCRRREHTCYSSHSSVSRPHPRFDVLSVCLAPVLADRFLLMTPGSRLRRENTDGKGGNITRVRHFCLAIMLSSACCANVFSTHSRSRAASDWKWEYVHAFAGFQVGRGERVRNKQPQLPSQSTTHIPPQEQRALGEPRHRATP